MLPSLNIIQENPEWISNYGMVSKAMIAKYVCIMHV